MNLLKKRLNSLKPRYLKSFEQLISRYAQFGGGSADDKFNKAKAFSNVYEFYVYAFFLGLAKDRALDIAPQDEAKSFMEIENWKPYEIAEQLLICAIGESDFDLNAVENMEKDEIYKETNKISATIEKYANGGFLYIQERLEESQDSVEDELIFVNFLTDD
ncbi:hypothetical protein [uncultured Alteromonas sp.]|uniref:hypothetical protein n=1 Tax=uncultured Alteromonas sp. TaxID=179113 RepID=UPI0030DCB447